MSLITAGEYLYKEEDAEVDFEKVRAFLYRASEYLKIIHSSNGYISSISMQNVFVDPTNPQVIHFGEVLNVNDSNILNKYKRQNIYELALMTLEAHLPRFDPSVFKYWDYRALAKNFNLVVDYFVEDDRDYFEEVFTNNGDSELSYYSDYINSLATKNMDSEDNSKSNSNKKGKQLTYSTLQGRLMTNDDSGFTGVLLLVILITVILIITGLIIIFVI